MAATAPSRPPALPTWMQLVQLVIGALVAYRIVYHAAYLRDVPFALATFSDGRQYETAALDILAHPPLGTQPFYLQGLYAYFMALPMAIEPWPVLALLLQLGIAGLALGSFWWAARWFLGSTRAGWATLLLLAYPMLAFYENKYLTAALAIATVIFTLHGLAWLDRRPSPTRAVVLGIALGSCVLARPNEALLIPFVLISVVRIAERHARPRRMLALATTLGCVAMLGTMAARNAVVTGRATVFPAHGGGTSFYIGNNIHARGVWNDAGGLLSGDVTRERRELVESFDIPPGSEDEQVQAIGRALYAKGLAEIASAPGRWLWLEVRKTWLMVGNDELLQDYDLLGERELIPFAHLGIPFGVLVVLGALGWFGWVEDTRETYDAEARGRRRVLVPTIVGLLVATIAANLFYFTSSQHRLPLVVPLALLGAFAGTALRRVVLDLRFLALASMLVALAAVAWPRQRVREPSAIHYFNLGVAYLSLDQPNEALAAFDRAVERRPDHPMLRLERASLAIRRGRFEQGRRDLQTLETLPALPGWARRRENDERRRVGLAPRT